MALTAKSLFLYGFQVTPNNSSIDFKAASLGPEKNATLTVGFYSLTALITEIKKQMEAVDPLNTYTVSVNRTIAGGTQNRVTILTSGSFLSLLFSSGTRTASNCATLIGFNVADYTGATTYTGSASAGTSVLTNLNGYNFLPPELLRKNFGSKNISASGVKETITYATQLFWQVQFKYIPFATANSDWVPLMTWMILQRLIEFTPEVTSPNSFYEGTLESTGEDGGGMAYRLGEMLPEFPNFHDTGMMKFRVNPS